MTTSAAKDLIAKLTVKEAVDKALTAIANEPWFADLAFAQLRAFASAALDAES
ncbi:hypothetical protein FRB94_013456 [Tulasnella sp. JGI-2019a]|nr:hypothetical protein FRB93_002305 [Tulasnella sp. JGI-2019a]KAG9008294.1 hypothetical protein FRB94_013456 [Tulasnella sp. JGI-2019a]